MWKVPMICASPFAIGGISSRTTCCDKKILFTMRSNFEMENIENRSFQIISNSLELLTRARISFYSSK